MSVSCDVRLRVPFHDLDPLQIVWHGNYFKYFDIARFGLFKEAGIDLYQYLIRHQIVFPVTRSAVKHIMPLRYDDEFICRATVVEAVYKIAIAFEIRLAESGKVCTRGKSEQFCVKLPEMEMRFEVGALNNCVGLSQYRAFHQSLIHGDTFNKTHNPPR